jgi:hypothetical protein
MSRTASSASNATTKFRTALAAFDDADEFAALFARFKKTDLGTAPLVENVLLDAGFDVDEIDVAGVFAAIAPLVGATTAESENVANATATNKTDPAPTPTLAPAGLAPGKVRTLFSKEIAKGGGFLDTLTPAMVACCHQLFGDPGGGATCMVCRHVTTTQVWKCETKGKHSGCAIELCGSCAFKWKRTLNK